MYSHRGCSFSLSVVEVLGCFMSMLFNESVAVRKVAVMDKPISAVHN
jgi:hypothetical protein